MKYLEFLEQLKSHSGSRSSFEDNFRRNIREILGGFDGGSIDDLNADVARVVEMHNRAPRNDFAGLSAEELHQLLYYPLEDRSPIRFRPEISHDVLDRIGFFRLVEELLKIVKRDGYIKLTAKLGTLPRKTLVELYDHHFVAQWSIDEGHIKLRHEDDSSVMGSLHGVARISRLVRKLHGKLVLTKIGAQMLEPNSRAQLFRLVFTTFTTKFYWAYNDFYPDFGLCQNAFGFSLYMLGRFGTEERHRDFYAEKFLAAFPIVLEEFQSESYDTPESSFKRCYKLRTFERFFEWFDLVEVRNLEATHWERQKSLVKKSDIMDAVFAVT